MALESDKPGFISWFFKPLRNFWVSISWFIEWRNNNTHLLKWRLDKTKQPICLTKSQCMAEIMLNSTLYSDSRSVYLGWCCISQELLSNKQPQKCQWHITESISSQASTRFARGVGEPDWVPRLRAGSLLRLGFASCVFVWGPRLQWQERPRTSRLKGWQTCKRVSAVVQAPFQPSVMCFFNATKQFSSSQQGDTDWMSYSLTRFWHCLETASDLTG